VAVGLLRHGQFGGQHFCLCSTEVVDDSEFAQLGLDLRDDVYRCLVFAKLQKCPKLLQSIEQTILEVSQGDLLEIGYQIDPKLLLQTITEESEKTFEAISVVRVGVFESELFELHVHPLGKMVAQEMRPKAEECVHLLRLTDPEPLALLEASRVEFLVLLLDKPVLLQQLVRGMLEEGKCFPYSTGRMLDALSFSR